MCGALAWCRTYLKVSGFCLTKGYSDAAVFYKDQAAPKCANIVHFYGAETREL